MTTRSKTPRSGGSTSQAAAATKSSKTSYRRRTQAKPNDDYKETVRAAFARDPAPLLDALGLRIDDHNSKPPGTYWVFDGSESRASLQVGGKPSMAGRWTRYGTDEGGDCFDLVCRHRGWNVSADFPQALEMVANVYGIAPQPPPVKVTSPSIVYEVRELTGELVALHHRRDLPDGTKKVWWSRPGMKTPGLHGRSPKTLPLYRVPDLAGLPAKTPVVVAEGEKACEALCKAGAKAVATYGADVLPDHDSLRPLRSFMVILWPDNDEAGRRHMADMASALQEFGTTVLQVDWPEAPDKGDAADALELYGPDLINELVGTAELVPLRSIPQRQTDAPQERVDRAQDRPAWNVTDVGNGQRFVARHGQDLRYCAVLGTWFVWDGKRWRPDAGNEVRQLAKETAKSIFVEASLVDDEEQQKALVKHALASERDRSLRAMLWCAETEPGIPVMQEELDADPWLLNVLNGTIDLRTGKLREHRREDLLTYLCPVDYNPEARSPLWEQFLEVVTGGDKGLQAFLQRVAGYALTGSTREEKLVFVYGPARSGKSTFLGALQATLGEDYAHTCDFDAFLKHKPSGAPKDDLANMAGKRLVVSIETDEGARLAEGLVKQLTGGDRVRARRLYANSFEFVPQFKLFLAANDRPKARDDDDALWERILEVPFPFSIPKADRDPAVKETLCDPAKSGAAILAWMIDGCLAWQRDGLQVPSVVEASTTAYRGAMNPLADFLDERCIVDPDVWASSADLFNAYREWAQEQGLRHTLAQKAFGEKLRAIGCEQRQEGVARTRGWSGIALLSEREGEH
jgi:putative DNA primase/helicase